MEVVLLEPNRTFESDQRNPGDADLKAAKQVIATRPDETPADPAAYFSSLRQGSDADSLAFPSCGRLHRSQACRDSRAPPLSRHSEPA